MSSCDLWLVPHLKHSCACGLHFWHFFCFFIILFRLLLWSSTGFAIDSERYFQDELRGSFIHLLIHSFNKYLLSLTVCQAHGIILLVLALVNSKVGMLSRIPEVSFSLNNYFGFLPFPLLNTVLIIYGQFIRVSSHTVICDGSSGGSISKLVFPLDLQKYWV